MKNLIPSSAVLYVSDRCIAQRALEKPVRNGLRHDDCVYAQVTVAESLRVRLHCRTHSVWHDDINIDDILFDEGDIFAKSFWGWGLNHTAHMQALARAKNPLKYLEGFL